MITSDGILTTQESVFGIAKKEDVMRIDAGAGIKRHILKRKCNNKSVNVGPSGALRVNSNGLIGLDRNIGRKLGMEYICTSPLSKYGYDVMLVHSAENMLNLFHPYEIIGYAFPDKMKFLYVYGEDDWGITIAPAEFGEDIIYVLNNHEVL